MALTPEFFATEFLSEKEGTDFVRDGRVEQIAAALREVGVTALHGILGAGDFGMAASLDTHRVVKLTTDETEVRAAAVLTGQTLPNVAAVYGAWFVRGVEVEQYHLARRVRAGIVVLQRLQPVCSSRRDCPLRHLSELVGWVKVHTNADPLTVDELAPAEARARLNAASLVLQDKLRELAAHPEYADFSSFEQQVAVEIARGLQALRERGVYTVDAHAGNIGYDKVDHTHKLFDVGSSSAPAHPTAPVVPARSFVQHGVVSEDVQVAEAGPEDFIVVRGALIETNTLEFVRVESPDAARMTEPFKQAAAGEPAMPRSYVVNKSKRAIEDEQWDAQGEAGQFLSAEDDRKDLFGKTIDILAIDRIEPPDQMKRLREWILNRSAWDREHVASLTRAMLAGKKVPPVTVQYIAWARTLRLVSGRHRVIAAQDAGFTHVPAMIMYWRSLPEVRGRAPLGPDAWRAAKESSASEMTEATRTRTNLATRFFHGSWSDLPVGTILHGAPGSERLPVEQAFEHMRPSSAVSRIGAVFMVSEPTRTNLDAAGGGGPGGFVYEVEPIGAVSGPYDGGWHAEIAKLYLDKYQDRRQALTKNMPAAFVRMTDAYWRGAPCRGDLCAGTWEWVTPEARILRRVNAR